MNKKDKNNASNVNGVPRNYTEEEVREQARNFVNKWMPKYEKYCQICGARNCKSNDNCIKCNCQF